MVAHVEKPQEKAFDLGPGNMMSGVRNGIEVHVIGTRPGFFIRNAYLKTGDQDVIFESGKTARLDDGTKIKAIAPPNHSPTPYDQFK